MSSSDKVCVYCGTPLVKGKKFCSVHCKSESQKKTILFKCTACGKEFRLWPCIKRKTIVLLSVIEIVQEEKRDIHVMFVAKIF